MHNWLIVAVNHTQHNKEQRQHISDTNNEHTHTHHYAHHTPGLQILSAQPTLNITKSGAGSINQPNYVGGLRCPCAMSFNASYQSHPFMHTLVLECGAPPNEHTHTSQHTLNTPRPTPTTKNTGHILNSNTKERGANCGKARVR